MERKSEFLPSKEDMEVNRDIKCTEFNFLTRQFCESYLNWCGVGLQNAQSYQAAVQEYKKNQQLLNLAKSLFQEQTSLDRLITSIIVQAKEMLQCERCTIFLLDLKMYDQVRSIIQKYSGIYKYRKEVLCFSKYSEGISQTLNLLNNL